MKTTRQKRPDRVIDTNNLVVTFGKHNGELWTRIPANYLRWLINQTEELPQFAGNKDIARAELERRGTTISHEVEISPHAVDKASLRVRKIWHETSKRDEGLYSWLSRVATEALKTVEGKLGRIGYMGIMFVFEQGNEFPILKTVIKK